MFNSRLHNPMFRFLSLVSILSLVLGSLSIPDIGRAANLAAPTSVTIAGSLQSELSCPGDWQPDCAATHLSYDSSDDVWQGSWTVPMGNWEYKAALNDNWDVSYGLNGANIPLSLGADTSVKFYYDDKSHWITDSKNSTIAVAVGSFQSELGCSGDWQPDCLRSWLQDVDGDGVFSFETTALPAGAYEAKVALNESWDINYGQGGVQNGPNIPFTVAGPSTVFFSWDIATKVLTVEIKSLGPSHDNNVEWDGLRHDSRDLLYRSPGGAVSAGTPVTIRFRTFHNDVTEVKLRVYDLNAAGQQLLPMNLVAEDVDCYQADLAFTCDYWEETLSNSDPNNLWYRFIVTDGSKTVY